MMMMQDSTGGGKCYEGSLFGRFGVGIEKRQAFSLGSFICGDLC